MTTKTSIIGPTPYFIIDWNKARVSGLYDKPFVKKLDNMPMQRCGPDLRCLGGPSRHLLATTASVKELNGIGPALAKKLAGHGVATVGALMGSDLPGMFYTRRQTAVLMGLITGLLKNTLDPA